MIHENSLKVWNSKRVDICIDSELHSLSFIMDEFSGYLRPGFWIFLNGELGSGKTTLTQKLLTSLGHTSPVVSPTFSLINVLKVENPRSAIKKVCHLDLYRLKSARELKFLGLEIELTSDSICIVEWAENVDPEGWDEFFKTTRCKRPMELIGISITQNHSSSRQQRSYEFRWLLEQEYLSVH